MVLPMRFFIHPSEDEDEKPGILGPVVIWIAVHPRIVINGPSLEKDQDAARQLVHAASLDILQLLRENGIEDVSVECYKGIMERFAGPPLLPSVRQSLDSTHQVRRFLTATLGIPIAAAGGAEATLGLLFHENKDEEGNPSSRVFGLTTKHFLCKHNHGEPDHSNDAPCLKVNVAGARRFEQGTERIDDAIRDAFDDVLEMLQHVEALAFTGSTEPDPQKQAENERRLERGRFDLSEARGRFAELEAFRLSVEGEWGDIDQRTIGHVDWAPVVSVDPETGYTQDLATFEVDPDKFRPQFRGNVVDLGTKYHLYDLEKKWPQLNTWIRAYDNAPRQVQKIGGVLTQEQLAKPVGGARPEGLTVGKIGSTTDLTLGRLSGLEAFAWSVDTDQESREMVIFNYDRESGSFSDKGDSGSLVFDGRGRMVGFVHSGTRYDECTHVTLATPAWWVLEQVKLKYPHADFDRSTF
ncbi:hypothetical protein BKA70DRAFT_39343 [Coprinopsis sp. MPI-PUGE-AT-0042]|nr:hypothetical protein BKA70DRAFT_39343 [Coprinopsis sp. MPI-PUGE-AT-0042]